MTSTIRDGGRAADRDTAPAPYAEGVAAKLHVGERARRAPLRHALARDRERRPDHPLPPGRTAAETVASAPRATGAARPAVVAEAPAWPEAGSGDAECHLSSREAGDDAAERGRQAQRERVIEAVLAAGATFWRDGKGDAYATIPHAGAIQRHRVNGRDFKRLVANLYGRTNPATGRAGQSRPGSVGEQAMREAINAFDAMAAEGFAREAGVRTCLGADGAAWLDLGCDRWRLVRITRDGWTVKAGADVPLIRAPGMLSLPEPVRDPAALGRLRGLLNVASEADLMLVVAWLVAALHPTGPYPVMAVDGEQGSAKSSTTRLLRRLVDPNLADARPVPREERDIVAAASNGRVVAFDNVSGLSAETADMVCRVATGAGFAERRLYSNGEECLSRVQAPVLLNGIPSLLNRGDLADRALAITLPAIPDHRRRTEAELWAATDAAVPSILGLLLDGLALALRDAAGLQLARSPRMADFARLACSAAPTFGWTADAMLDALDANRRAAREAVVEAEPVAEAMRTFAHGLVPGCTWRGTPAELLVRLNGVVLEEVRREARWPRDAARLGAALRRVRGALAGVGVTFTEGRTATGRWVEIPSAAWPAGPERSGNSITPADGGDWAGEV